jgi:TPR repeat protein
VTPTALHRARWYYSAACGQGDPAACDEARRLMDEEPTLPPSTEDPRADLSSESAAPGTHVAGAVNVYGGTVYFGPVTNVFVGQPGQSPAPE